MTLAVMLAETPRLRSRRVMVVGIVAIVGSIFGTGAMVAQRTRRQFRAEELEIASGLRALCKRSTVELPVADYARRPTPGPAEGSSRPETFLFYSGVVAAGFDGCDRLSDIAVNHRLREVTVGLPPARVVAVDTLRFEAINQPAGWLGTVAPEERGRWSAEARAAMEKTAVAEGAPERAEANAREAFAAFVEKRGYTLVVRGEGGSAGAAAASGERTPR